jgi:Ca2+-binding RTX toxin-like protein
MRPTASPATPIGSWATAAPTRSAASAATTCSNGGGGDRLEGGSGNDTATYHDSPEGVTVSLIGGTAEDGDAEGDTFISIENLSGSLHADHLWGDDNVNVLRGQDGVDWLGGHGGSDSLYGGDDNDTLEGGVSGDILDGGDGTDTAVYFHSDEGVFVSLINNTAAYGDAAGDTFHSVENLTGSDHADTLWGDDFENVLWGGDGNNQLKGFGGDDTLFGGYHDDTLEGGRGADYLEGAEGIDTATYAHSDEGVRVSLIGETAAGGDAEGDQLHHINNLTGSDHGDELEGDDGANVLLGRKGNDELAGGAGDDTIDGGEGIDTASYENSPDSLIVSLRADTAAGGHAEGDELDGIENIIGSAHADRLTGDANANLLTGLSGDDTLDGGSGGDTMEGGSDDDTYVVDNAADEVTELANEGTDLVKAGIDYALGAHLENLTLLIGAGSLAGTGNALGNVITGNDSDNALNGRRGADTLFGGEGNDVLDGGRELDWMAGEADNDTYYVDNAGDVVAEAVGEGILDDVRASVSYSLAAGAEVELLSTTSAAGTAAINLTGNEFDNTIAGNDGRNTIVGGGGVDTLVGHRGDDTYIVDTSADEVIEAIGQGYDRVQTGATYVLAAGSEVEVLETTDAAGTTALDLVGNEFDNTIIGNDGTNTIVGSPDSDGGGYDGLDTMTGNGGSDTFVWTSTAETTLAGQDADIVMDFNRAEGDLLAFNQIDADATGGTADDAFTFVGIVDVTAGDSFTGVGQIGYFTADTNGDSVNDMTYILLNTEMDAGVDYQDATIRLAGAFTVDASWFVL